MIVRTLATGAIIVGLAVPAFADKGYYADEQLTSRYYVGQDPATKKCSILFVKPDRTKYIQIGSAQATESDALAAMETAAACKSP